MQPPTTTTLLALVLFLVRPTAEELTFEPEEGSEVVRTFVFTSEVSLDELAFQVDGEDLSALLGDFSFEMEAVQTFVATDRILAASDGTIERLSRTYEELQGESEVMIDTAAGSESVESTASSELEGATVLFTLEDGEYVASAAEDSDVEEELLGGLEFAMDLAGFLPGASVDEGDSWDVELLDLGGVFMPGGNLGLMPDGGLDGMEGLDADALTDMMTEYQQEMMEMIDEWVDGGVQATFVGSDDGVGLVEIELDLAVDADLSGMMQDILDELLSQMDVPVEVDMSVDLVQVQADTEGDGKLEWQIDAKRGRSLALTLDYDFEVDFEVSASAEGETYEVAAQIAGAGTVELDVSVE